MNIKKRNLVIIILSFLLRFFPDFIKSVSLADFFGGLIAGVLIYMPLLLLFSYVIWWAWFKEKKHFLSIFAFLFFAESLLRFAMFLLELYAISAVKNI